MYLLSGINITINFRYLLNFAVFITEMTKKRRQ